VPADYFDRERKHLQAQVFEVRSELASIGQRQHDLRANDGVDSVEARNTAEQLQAEREQALRELNRINEDLRKLALLEETRAKEEREAKRLADVDAARAKEELAREERDKADRLRDAIDRKDELLREELDRQAQARETDAREAQTRSAPEASGPGGSPGSDGPGNALSDAGAAIGKTADALLELSQMAQHALERQQLEERHRQELEAQARRHAEESRALAEVHHRDQVAADIRRQERQQMEERQERERIEAELERARQQRELERRQAELERERNERAERDGLSR
jgi:hypothetical protein